MITYTDYPSLLFTSYNKDNAPAELPFEVDSEDTRQYLVSSQGFNEMFGIIASLNSLGFSPSHYWITNKRFADIEYSDTFRTSGFIQFVTAPHPGVQYGCILFKEGGQYIYLLLPESKDFKQVGGVYIAAALFRKNIFVGFEEGVIKQNLAVIPGGFYKGGMDIGGYLSFVAISLSFFNSGNTTLVNNHINATKETIYTKM